MLMSKVYCMYNKCTTYVKIITKNGSCKTETQKINGKYYLAYLINRKYEAK